MECTCIHDGIPKQCTNFIRYKLRRYRLIRFNIEGQHLQFLTYQMLCYYEGKKESETQR